MRWRPWPPLISKKYEVRIAVRGFEGGDWVHEGTEENCGSLAVEIRWKGAKVALGSFGRAVRRNYTREEVARRAGDGEKGGISVEWNEEFKSVCSFSGYRDNVFHSWEISFSVLHVLNQGVRNKVSVVGSANLNLSEYASRPEDQDAEVKIPLTVSGTAVEHCPLLYISLSFLELVAAHEPAQSMQNSMMPLQDPVESGETSSSEKDEMSALKTSLRKVKIFTDYVSTRRPKKVCHEEGSEGHCTGKSEDSEYGYPSDSDLLEGFVDDESDEGREDSAVRKSFSYGTLPFANCAGGLSYYSARTNNKDEDWIYYSNRRRSDVCCSHADDLTTPELTVLQNTKRSILPWRKRKLSFRSPKAKGEPLLKKAYAEEGGDDIDFDRRQLSSDESASFGWHKNEDLYANHLPVSEFGDDSFAVGTWEQKEIMSRDGHMKLHTQVFFASIDQRNERAAGESACTVLVAVIADWLQNNHKLMPIKSQFDSLIRDGSLEWRNLCENETYMDRFPDKHFDLETVVNTRICDICVVPGKSFIGFFHPEEKEEGNFEFLHSAMSFDNIWNEIVSMECSSSGESPIYVVSWNDHFFVLKVETDAYYIIDTLGERLHEGCNQAYILKFDRSTTIFKLPSQLPDDKPITENVAEAIEPQNLTAEAIDLSHSSIEGSPARGSAEQMSNEYEEEIVCRGKESCREYIKSFLAAVPIRQLQADIKKGLPTSKPLHHRLQIEFHFTQLQQSASLFSATDAFTCPIVDVTQSTT